MTQPNQTLQQTTAAMLGSRNSKAPSAAVAAELCRSGREGDIRDALWRKWCRRLTRYRGGLAKAQPPVGRTGTGQGAGRVPRCHIQTLGMTRRSARRRGTRGDDAGARRAAACPAGIRRWSKPVRFPLQATRAGGAGCSSPRRSPALRSAFVETFFNEVLNRITVNPITVPDGATLNLPTDERLDEFGGLVGIYLPRSYRQFTKRFGAGILSGWCEFFSCRLGCQFGMGHVPLEL